MKYDNFLNQLDQYYSDHNYSNAYESDIIGQQRKLEIIDAGYKKSFRFIIIFLRKTRNKFWIKNIRYRLWDHVNLLFK